MQSPAYLSWGVTCRLSISQGGKTRSDHLETFMLPIGLQELVADYIDDQFINANMLSLKRDVAAVNC